MSLKDKLFTIVSIAALFLICTPPPTGWYRWNVLVFVGIAFALLLYYVLHHGTLSLSRPKSMPLKVNVVLAMLYAILGILFISHAQHASKINTIADVVNIDRRIIAAALFVIAIIVSWPVMTGLIKGYFATAEIVDERKEKNGLLYGNIILLLSSITAITLFSKSSFLYPINDWVDANDYHTIGKSILYGYVPYRDLFDHKGPILYFLHAFNGFVSFRSFVGIYILEIISCFLFLKFSYNSISLFSNRNAIAIMPVVAFVIYSAWCFEQGDSAEEFCLPALAYGLWVGLKCTKNASLLSKKDGIFVGLCIGWIFWIKYSILGFYVGFCLFFAAYCIYKRQIRELAVNMKNIAAGFILISIPVIFYFVWNGAVGDLIQVYFHDNIFLYNATGEDVPFVKRLFEIGWYGAYCRDFIFFLLLIASLAVVARNGRISIIFYFTCFVFSSLFAYIPQTIYVYYTLPLSIFVPLGAVVLFPLLQQGNKAFSVSLVVILCVAIMFSCLNFQIILQPKASRPQYKFKEIICQKDNPTLLNYEFGDMGLFAVCGILPSNKYFFASHLNHDYIMSKQDEVIRNGEVDFIVTKRYAPDSYPTFPNYEMVAEEYYINWYRGPEYMYLYKKKSVIKKENK